MQMSLFCNSVVDATGANPPEQNKIELPVSESQEIVAPSDWGVCRICGSPIAIIGLDASLCSNLERSCGSSGWVFSKLTTETGGGSK